MQPLKVIPKGEPLARVKFYRTLKEGRDWVVAGFVLTSSALVIPWAYKGLTETNNKPPPIVKDINKFEELEKRFKNLEDEVNKLKENKK